MLQCLSARVGWFEYVRDRWDVVDFVKSWTMLLLLYLTVQPSYY